MLNDGHGWYTVYMLLIVIWLIMSSFALSLVQPKVFIVGFGL